MENISPLLSLYIFVDFMKKEPTTKFYGVFDQFSRFQEVIRLLISVAVNTSSNTKCVSLINQKCEIQRTVINLHPDKFNKELHCYPFVVKLN